MKIKLLFLLVIFNWMQIGYSQNVDSLLNILKIESNDSLKIEYNFEIATYYYNNSEYDSAYNYFQIAYSFADKLNNFSQKSRILIQLGNSMYWTAYYQEADSLFKKSLIYAEQINDSNLIAESYMVLGVNKRTIGDKALAKDYLMLSLQICPENNKNVKGRIYANIGQLEFTENNLEESLRYFLLSENIWKQIKNLSNVARIQFEKGKIYYKQKKYYKSISSIHSSLKSDSIDTLHANKTIQIWKYRRLAEAYEAIGKFDSAYFFFVIHSNMYKEIFHKNKVENIKRLELNYENELKTHENKNLKSKNILQSKTIRNKNIFVIISIIVSSIVLFIFALLLYNRKRLRVANNLLTGKNEEIKLQKEDLEKFNQKLFASNLKIDQQNLEVMNKNKEIQLQSEKLTEKTIDLLVLNREIRQTAKLREGLTNMIVHDLKNPISSIINLTENKEITYFAKEILTMVENILDVQKFEGMLMPLNKRDYSLKDITDSAVKQIEVFAEHKNIQIENKILKKYHVNIDEDIIRRVFVNLLSNAIKYTPANGFIKIDFDIKAVKKDFILVKVIDSGIGIRKDKIDIIFNKFKQVMAKKTGLARSTGLGLTFCKMAIEAHDSKIVVDSVPGKETVFSFEFELIKERNYEKSNENCVVSELNTTLNELDKSYLKKFYDELKEFDVYEIGKLRKVTNQIDMNHSDGIHKWKLELEKAIYNCNSELYDEMVNSIVIDFN